VALAAERRDEHDQRDPRDGDDENAHLADGIGRL
jgi:hypothetical protein